MDHSVPYTLPGLTMPVGPHEHESEPARCAGPVVLDIEFTYEAGYPARAPSLGDPGDDGIPEEFDFKRVMTTHPLVLVPKSGDLRVIINSGADIYPRLSFETLARIETDLIQGRRESRIQGRLDAAVISRFVDFGALQ